MILDIASCRIAVLGLGYVGLPLAIAFSKSFETVGYDLSQRRIMELKQNHDVTSEVSTEALGNNSNISFTEKLDDLAHCNVYIVTVPTPIDDYKRPDLTPLITASKDVGKVISAGDIVIYESTVYPGATEEECLPVVEHVSGLRCNQDFFAGYSPERVNPGDRSRTLASIKKVTSGSTADAADFVDALYGTIITAGTHKVTSIRIAEAAKVIENTQRDVNIALINEFALIFDRMGLNTLDILEAAGTKWNFIPFRPGLVGGHCIGVDPYYLASKAQSLGYYPEIVLAGRRINDGMGGYVAQRVLRSMIQAEMRVKGSKVLILGLTFKEDCPDLRNTRVIDIKDQLSSLGVQVDIHDPWVQPDDALNHLGVEMCAAPQHDTYDAVIVAVAHRIFVEQGPAGIRAYGSENTVMFDLKGAFHTDSHARELGFEEL